jgi:hypothetical protein
VADDFFIPEVFECVDDQLPEPKSDYRVVSFGLHPSLAQHHGYFTLDGYVGLYSLQYKKRFRKVVVREMRKNIDVKRNFDKWGSRVYLFSSELGLDHMIRKDAGIVVRDLDIRTGILFRLGARFLLSAVEIANAHEIGLHHLAHCSHPDRPYEVHVYAILHPSQVHSMQRKANAEAGHALPGTEIQNRNGETPESAPNGDV